jgi:ubiquinone/menaquinone biosynthesis C-methylase UbiE
MPFDDETFDGTFTNGSLHEWSQTAKILDEIYRCLKNGGKYMISDMRRDEPFFLNGS